MPPGREILKKFKEDPLDKRSEKLSGLASQAPVSTPVPQTGSEKPKQKHSPTRLASHKQFLPASSTKPTAPGTQDVQASLQAALNRINVSISGRKTDTNGPVSMSRASDTAKVLPTPASTARTEKETSIKPSPTPQSSIQAVASVDRQEAQAWPLGQL